MKATSILGYTSTKCVNWVKEPTVQLFEKATKARISGKSDYWMLQKIIAIAAWRETLM